MAHPKRQHSKQRSRKRRGQQTVDLPSLANCPQCQKPILSHRVCPFCGFYKGKPVLTIKEKEEKPKQ